MLLYQKRLLTVEFLGMNCFCFSSKIRFIPGCDKRFWCCVLPAEPAHSKQDGKCRSSDAGGPDPQVFTWSYLASGNKNQPARKKKNPDQAEISEYNCIHLSVQDSFLTEQSTRLVYSCGVLLPFSLPSTTAGIDKGWECWDRACLKPCAQLGQLYSWVFFLCLVLVIPFILSCSYRAKSEKIIYSKLLNI